MDVKATWLIAPTVKNSSCNHPRFSASLFEYIGPLDVIQALLILMLTIGIIGANFLVIFVINHRRYSPYIHPQPRYLLTSLALNDFAIGLLIAPFGVLPALFHCWPYGEIFCQIQALLRGALSQQSAVILVCMAVDRYMCTLHPDKYHQHSSKKGCVAILSITWTLCLTMFGLLVLPKGYYFNNTGLLVCEPFFSKPSYRILATCSFYFPTTMILMYCYGSSFHVSRFHNYNCNNVGITPSVAKIPEPQQQQLPNTSTSLETLPPSQTTPTIMNDKPLYEIITQERRLNGSASRTMAAMSLGFIVMVTPWTIQEVVAACTGSKVPPFLDFIVTWTAISNSFWNPFLYWLLNAHFRRISKEILPTKWCYSCRNDNDDGSITPQKSRCCSLTSVECDTMQLPLPPGPPSSRPPRTDIEGLSEKYWGEILERTVSSNSLHLLQRSYGLDGNTSHHNHILHNHHHHHHLHFNNTNNNNNNNNSNNINTSEFIENSKQSEHLSKFSNSEPKLYEHFHDINCAKNKAFLNDNRHSIKGLPDI